MSPVDQFSALYEETFTRVLAYCRRRARNPSDADDAVSETYTVAWRRLDDCLGAESPIAWLYGVAYRVLGNQYRGDDRARRLGRKMRLQRPHPPPTEPAEAVTHADEVAAVFEALGQLDPKDQELIRLAAFEELSYAEIAAATGLRTGAVRSRLFRARRRLDEMARPPEGRDQDRYSDTQSGGMPDNSAADTDEERDGG